MQGVSKTIAAGSASPLNDGWHPKDGKLLTSLDWHARALGIASVAKTASLCMNPPVFIRHLYKAMSTALCCNRFALYVIDADGRQMVECSSVMDVNFSLGNSAVRMPKDWGRTEIIMEGTPEIVDCQSPRADDYVTDELLAYGCNMLLVAPLVEGAESFGVYCAMYESMQPITDQDIEYARILGQVAGPLINSISWRPSWNDMPGNPPAEIPVVLTRDVVEAPPDSVSVHITQKAREELVEKDHRLTKRERELMELIADGLSNQEIANQLYLSNSTVKKYVASLMRKIGAQNRVQIAAHAIEMRLLDDRVFK